MVLNSLLPHSLWEHFEKITQIPRPSGKEGKMVEHIARIAEENGLSFKTDAFRNILVSKPATKGRESSPRILLQAHTDMVCEKNQEVDFDFSTQPIQTEIEGDWVKAKGTTLGADDGIGVAMMLNILTSKDLEHGPIDCLFTSDEEVGMTGAIHLDSEILRAKKMINLDSEEEGAITIGCSGGTDIYINIPLELESVGEGNYCFSLSVSGGMGGHSGGDIHLGRSNANKLIVNFLHLLEEEMRVRLVDFAGGSARNAIPRYSSIKAIIPFEQKEKVRTLLNIYTSEVEKKFAEIDPKITFSLESEDIPSQCITEELSK
ncbi:MAG TPA: cytosol nonspecific dipeptidase, partial [Porphyromonadaceae bacterium]|nr:cytosol nonspecific dipeptidase [Porphyromonadaceae bacterium]